MLDKRTKWSFSLGAIGRDMAYAYIGMFLLVYIQYTIKLTAVQFTAISTIMFVCLIFDAFSDVFMGTIIENARLKSGKFRPWIITGATINAIMLILLFVVRPEGWLFVCFFGVSYLLWGISFTMNDISYWGLLPALTSDSNERTSLVSLVTIFASIGQVLVAGLVPIVVPGNAVRAYAIASVVIAVVFVVFQLLIFVGVKEKKREDAIDKVTIGNMFKVLKRNDQLIICGIVIMTVSLANGVFSGFGLSFFYFEFSYSEGGAMLFKFTVAAAIASILAPILWGIVSKKIVRLKLLKYSTIFMVTSFLLLLSVGFVIPKSHVIINILGFFIYLFNNVYMMTLIVMLSNTIEYDQYHHQFRHDSIISAVRSFSVKLSSGIKVQVVTLGFLLSGIFDATQKIAELEVNNSSGLLTKAEVIRQANVIIGQSDLQQLLLMRMFMCGVPMIAYIIAYIIIKRKYKIDEETYEYYVNEIEKRSKEGVI